MGARANLNLCGSFPRRDTAFLAAPVKYPNISGPLRSKRPGGRAPSTLAMLVSGATFHPVLNAHSQSSHNGPHETLEAELMLLSPHHRRIIYLRPNYEPPPASV